MQLFNHFEISIKNARYLNLRRTQNQSPALLQTFSRLNFRLPYWKYVKISELIGITVAKAMVFGHVLPLAKAKNTEYRPSACI